MLGSNVLFFSSYGCHMLSQPFSLMSGLGVNSSIVDMFQWKWLDVWYITKTCNFAQNTSGKIVQTPIVLTFCQQDHQILKHCIIVFQVQYAGLTGKIWLKNGIRQSMKFSILKLKNTGKKRLQSFWNPTVVNLTENIALKFNWTGHILICLLANYL